MLEDDKLEKASGNNLGYMFTQVHQARRLEFGQSTQNLNLHAIIEAIERDEKRQQRLKEPEGKPDEEEADKSS